ncbi:hypothetical protein ACH3VR_09680 [Microbacterium sp. B2969]|uniref:ATP-citrate synthase/succinyl-CoA ligase C-terminal domain-containing protein n=1 Tax=Microbacterium alkaliflavum TaxID=3248839 RepID=A0ABW7Q7B8_9MICO
MTTTAPDRSPDARRAGSLPHRVRPGRIGLVGPAGAASAEPAVRVHDFGAGISRWVETTHDDLADGAAGTGTIRGIDALLADDETGVILVVALSPAPEAAERVLERVRGCRKPVVVCFVGAAPAIVDGASACGLTLHTRTKPAALAAVAASGVDESTLDLHALNWPLIHEVRSLLAPPQHEIRGLFTSRALWAETASLVRETHGDVAAIAAIRGTEPAGLSRGHVLLDLSALDDPAVMSAERARHLRAAADDPMVGVVVVDFTLGRHPDPVGALAPAIVEAKAIATAQGRHLEVLGYVLGTEDDTPSLSAQAAALVATGATWASSSTNTGLLAREFVVSD